LEVTEDSHRKPLTKAKEDAINIAIESLKSLSVAKKKMQAVVKALKAETE
jgi:hypothetical protein